MGFADSSFNVMGGKMMQFNIRFDPAWRSPQHTGVKFLREVSRLALDDHAARGVPPLAFTTMLRDSGLLCNDRYIWSTYMGYTDIGFLLRLVLDEPLPEDRLAFSRQVQHLFPSLVDCKLDLYIPSTVEASQWMKSPDVARVLGVQRAGGTGRHHQAASDALLTPRCLERLRELAWPQGSSMRSKKGLLYGI
ncbi:hypothetical protein BS78_10G001500 [Paspalum vaginatum]|nr:hypothetical protein BS78_10G001500 [Paspalum vaginatum]